MGCSCRFRGRCGPVELCLLHFLRRVLLVGCFFGGCLPCGRFGSFLGGLIGLLRASWRLLFSGDLAGAAGVWFVVVGPVSVDVVVCSVVVARVAVGSVVVGWVSVVVVGSTSVRGGVCGVSWVALTGAFPLVSVLAVGIFFRGGLLGGLGSSAEGRLCVGLQVVGSVSVSG